MTEFYVGQAWYPQMILPINECHPHCINGAVSTFNKGYTPPPFSISGFGEGNGIRITFSQASGIEECLCSIECVGTPTIVNNGESGAFCPATTDYIYDFGVDSVDEGDTTTFSFTFIDSNGNKGNIQVDSLIYTKAQAPSRVILKENNYYYVELGVPFSSTSGKNLKPHIDHYKVEMYENNTGNAKTLYGWSRFDSVSSPVHILNRKSDVITTKINAGTEYGFRVSYRNAYDEASIVSDWVTAKDTDYVSAS